MQAFNNAKDGVAPQAAPLKTEGTAANGKDSEKNDASLTEQKKDQKIDNKTQSASEKPAEAKPADKAKPAESTKTEAKDAQQAEAAEVQIPEETQAVVATAAQQLIDMLAQLLNMDPEELTQALSDLDISGMDLLSPGAGNELAAQLLAGGDISALVTDQSLADVAAQLTELIGEAVENLKADTGAQAEQLFGPALDKVIAPEAKAPEAAQSVEDLFSDAIAPAEETVVQPMAKSEAAAQQQGEAKQDGEAAGRKEDRERFDYHDFRTEQAPVSDTMNLTQPEAPAVAEELPQLSYVSDPEEILNQVADHIKSNVTEDMSSLEMVLHPASLGSVAVRLVSQDGQVTAQFTAQNDAVRDALQSQLAVLKENMEQAGVKVEAVEVTVASHAFEQNLEQGNDGQSEAEAKEQEKLRRATHRIDLGDYAEGEAIPVDEADALTVEMMQADGNRMDYRA